MEPYEILLDGDFGWEINHADFSDDLARAAGADLKILANSPGGSVSAATAIRNALAGYMRKYPSAKVHFEVQGWAQSAMTYLMTAPGTTVSVGPDSLYMYHNPATLAFGDHNEMAKQTQFLKDLAETYATAYAARSGKDVESVRSDMDAETYFIGQAIVDAGFADAVEGEAQEDAQAHQSVLVEMAREQMKSVVGRMAAAAWGNRKEVQPEAPADDNNQTGDTEMSDEKKTETKAPDVSMETKRAKAWMAATKAEPEMAEALESKFNDGASEDFFKGIAAAAEMKAEASKNAQAHSEDAVPPVVTDENTTSGMEAAAQKTPGATGETAEV